LAIRKRRPWNVNLGICYVPSTSQTSQSDVFWTSLGLHCAIWDVTPNLFQKRTTTVLQTAIINFRVRLRPIKLILRLGAEVTATEENDQTPLHTLAASGSLLCCLFVCVVCLFLLLLFFVCVV
jgi:hypothetical protein